MSATLLLRALLGRRISDANLFNLIVQYVGRMRCHLCDEHSASAVNDTQGKWHWYCVDCVMSFVPDETHMNIHCGPFSLQANHSQDSEDELLILQVNDADDSDEQ